MRSRRQKKKRGEKKAFRFDFIKRSKFPKPTILINSELKRNTYPPGGRNVWRGGGDRTKPLRQFRLIFRYFAIEYRFYFFPRHFLKLSRDKMQNIKCKYIDRAIRLIIPRKSHPGKCNLLASFCSDCRKARRSRYASEYANFAPRFAPRREITKSTPAPIANFNSGPRPPAENFVFHPSVLSASPPAACNYITPTS